jgi:hypothetical protein
MEIYGNLLGNGVVSSPKLTVGYTQQISGSGQVPIISGGSYVLPYPLGPLGTGPVVVQVNGQNVLGWGQTGTGSGYSGYSGFSGLNGEFSASGFSGFSGYSGIQGISGFSGSGVSGLSGFSGLGISGYSGYSGSNGSTGVSGYSGYSGISGFSGSGTSVSGLTGQLVYFNTNSTIAGLPTIFILNPSRSRVHLWWHLDRNQPLCWRSE